MPYMTVSIPPPLPPTPPPLSRRCRDLRFLVSVGLSALAAASLLFVHNLSSSISSPQQQQGRQNNNALKVMTGISSGSDSTRELQSVTTVESDCTCIDVAAKRIEIFEKSSPSVVNVDTFAKTRDPFSLNVLEVPLGTGSGFVWDDKGHIVTNYHVISDSTSAQVAMITKSTSEEDMGSSSREDFEAEVVGVDPATDVAVLKIDAKNLHPISKGSKSTDLKVGEDAIAIGNPFGFDHTLTSGVISGLNREMTSPTGRPIANCVQTDAAVNPGNSGGPLLNMNGDLIGMNTMIYSPSGASAGIGFAIPVQTIKKIVTTLIEEGEVVRPMLGITFLGSQKALMLGVKDGVLVMDVPESSPAYEAGLKGTRRNDVGVVELGDVITKFDEHEITNEGDLFRALETKQVNDTVKLTVRRTVENVKTMTVILETTLQESSIDDTGFFSH